MSEPAAPAPQALPVRLVGTVGAVTLDVVAALGGSAPSSAMPSLTCSSTARCAGC